jgi:hypothetical protein
MLDEYLDLDPSSYPDEGSYLNWSNIMKHLHEVKKKSEEARNKFYRTFLVKHNQCNAIMKSAKEIMDKDDNIYLIKLIAAAELDTRDCFRLAVSYTTEVINLWMGL